MKTAPNVLTLIMVLGILLSLTACGSTAPAQNTAEEAPAAETSASTLETTEAIAEPQVESSLESAEAQDQETASAEEPAEDPDAVHETASGASYNRNGYLLPLFEDEVTLSYRCSLSGGDVQLMGTEGYAMNEAAKAAYEATGVRIEWSTPSGDNGNELFDLAVAAGDYEDIISNAAGCYSGTLVNAISEGVFADIYPYMGDNMPFYTDIVKNSDESTKRGLITEEGFVCGVETITDYDVIVKEGPMIRTDYLNAVGMDMPGTYDELHTVLEAFRDQLGIAQPLMLPAGLVFTSNSLCAGFDVSGTFDPNTSRYTPWYQVDGVIKFGLVEQGYRDYIEMIHTWYTEGLISPDFIEKNDNPMGSSYLGAIMGGDAGMFFGENELLGLYLEGKSYNPDYDIAIMPEMVKEPGQTTHFINDYSQLKGDMVAINANCENIEAALTWLDYFFTPDGCKLGNVGVEGISYEEVNGTYQWLDSFLYNEQYNDKERNVIFILTTVPCLGIDAPDTYTLDIQKSAQDIWITNDDGAYVLPNIALNEEESATYAKLYSDISTYLAEHLTKFVVGDQNMAEWDSLMDTVFSMGMQDCIDIYQAALDRYYAIDVSPLDEF